MKGDGNDEKYEPETIPMAMTTSSSTNMSLDSNPQLSRDDRSPGGGRRRITLGKKAAERAVNLKKFDLKRCRDSLLKIDIEEKKQMIKECHLEIQKFRQKIKKPQRDNNALAQKVAALDEQIQKVIKGEIKAEEALAKAKEIKKGAAQAKPTEGFCAVMTQYKRQYGQLFWLLQNHPRYLARLTPHVTSEFSRDFVRTVIFDLFGDSYDSREERLLLTLFQLVLQARFDKAENEGSLFRANDAVSQMLSSYARRGLGLGILKDILQKPLQDIVRQKDLNLEINPVMVYKQIIKTWESQNPGQEWSESRNVTSEVASKRDDVIKVQKPVVKQLIDEATHLFKAVNKSAEKLPYGVRWVCKQLAEMAKTRFPDLDRYKVGSLVGGYIHLRFFNPVIVSPETANFVDKIEVTKQTRRNLVLVAKMLQALSNGVKLGTSKEPYMGPLQNRFIEPNKEPILDYFDRLIDVPDLQDRAEFDDLLRDIQKREATLQLDFNQMIVMHRLVMEHKNEIMDKTPRCPLKHILAELGAAEATYKATSGQSPKKVDMKNNAQVNILLHAPGSSPEVHRASPMATRRRGQSSQAYDKSLNTPIVCKVRELVKNIFAAKQIPEEIYTKNSSSFPSFLTDVKAHAGDNGDGDLLTLATGIEENISRAIKVAPSLSVLAGEDPQNAFVLQLAMNAEYYDRGLKNQRDKVGSAQQASITLNKFRDHLKKQQADYIVYLENVSKNAKQNKSKTNAKFKGKKKEFSHDQLVRKQVITSVASEYKQTIMQKHEKILYKFHQKDPNKFEIQVKYKTMIKKINIIGPIHIMKGVLLGKRRSGQETMWLQHATDGTLENLVEVSVEHTLELLDKEFKDKGLSG